MTENEIKKIEKIIHYCFKNKKLLVTAFTHSSYAHQYGEKSNERLEYLGDSILNFVIARELFNNYDVEEGQLSKWRSKLVNTDSLSRIVEEQKLDNFLLLGGSFKNQTLAKPIKEDLFESIVGAIYLDSSMDKASRFILRFIDPKVSIKKAEIDYKSLLQERVQQKKGANLVYFTYEDPLVAGDFCSEVYINDFFVARSKSQNKKSAQMECAKLALENEKLLNKILD